MAEQQTTDSKNEEIAKGRVLDQWTFPEFIKHERGPGWYAAAGLIGIALFIYAIVSGNFLFALIILLIAIIIFNHNRSEPMMIPFQIYQSGVQVGDKFYLYRDIDSFAIVYEPPAVKRLYITLKAATLRREISIPLNNKNPLKVRSTLLDFLEEDLTRDKESMNDAMARVFKI